MVRSRSLHLHAGLAALCLFTAGELAAQSPSVINAVQLTATVQSAPPRITLNWPSLSGTSSITIYRKLKTDTGWGSTYASPGGSATSYQDNGVTVGTYYEYKVVRSASSGTGYGYIASGIEVGPVEYRGKLVLLVDNTLAPSMTSELNQLQTDLKGDGWTVLRHDVSRTASVSSIRSIVQSDYNADPTNVKCVYSVGHVPVPYSGNINPDGHATHLGAWSCDGYYGELNSTWTDNTVNSTGAQRVENHNVPGDGKFDQSDFPSALEVQVGRVDLYDMTAFSASEINLMKAYLNKAHSFKIKGFTPQVRGVVFDNLQWVSNPLAGCSYRSMAPLVGSGNITDAYPYGPAFSTFVNGQSYLWTYSSGGGLQAMEGSVLTFNGADNIGTTQTYAASGYSFGGVFNMSFGSYFGDWDNKNNFLKAPLGSGNALTSVWAAVPNWWFHNMGLGDPIGYSTLLSMNNSSLYTPVTGGWSSGKVGMGLMGDPSLRMTMVAPPSNLSIGNSGGNAAFAWTASPDAILGYYIYQINLGTGAVTRVVPTLVTGTSYSSPSVPFVSGAQYMVRAVKLEVNYSGSYYNLSLGAIGNATGGATPDCLGVPGGTALPGTPCDDGNAGTINDTWSAGCVCVGTPGCTAPAVVNTTSNSPICSGATLNLSVVASGTAPLTYQWTGTGTFNPNSTSASVTVTGAVAGNYQVTVSNACGSTTGIVTVSLVPAPTTANAGPDQSVCSTVATMAANTASVGSSVWSQVSGPSSASLSAASSPTCQMSGLVNPGTYVFQWTITNGACVSSDQVSVIVGSALTTANAGGDQSTCGTSVTMAANTPSVGTGAWSQVSGPSCAITTTSSPSTTITAMNTAGNYVFQWTISSAGCTSSSDQVTITKSAAPTTANAGNDQSTCTTSVTMAANTPSVGSGSWSQVSGPSCTITTASSPSTTITGMNTAGNYVFQWTISSAGCTSSSDQVTITKSAAPTTANAGNDQSTCGTSVTMAANTPSVGSGSWSQVSGPSCTITTASSPSTTITSMNTAGNYVFQWTISSAGCTSSSDQVTITKSAAPTTANAGSDQSTCGTSVTMAGNTPSVGSGAWSQVSGPSCTITTASSPSTTITGMNTAGNYVFQWTISSAGCTSSSDQVTITKSAAPTTANAGGDQSTCGTSVTMAGNTPSVGSGAWSQVSGPSCTITTASSPSTTITGMNTAGNYVFQWTISSAGCTSSSDQVTITKSAAPTTANAGNDQSTCGTSVTMAGNTPSVGSGSWSQVSGPSCTITTASSPSTMITGMSTAGNYVFQWTISSAGCTSSSDQVTITRNLPPNAGTNGMLAICSSAAPANLFGQLGGSPQAGGTWTAPGGASHSATYDPAIDVPGIYTYTVTGIAPCANASSTVTVTETATMNWYADVDGDGAGDPNVSQGSCTQPAGYVSNNNDLCPSDPNKTAPGQCGCGLPDTDSDADGLADCVDACPNGPNPGATCNDGNACTANDVIGANCQCSGTAVADTDGDGACDVIDGCPNDANKTSPGLCGCGNLEPGAACDDGDNGTINDIIGSNCQCAGTAIAVDCLGVPGGSALPGTSCDDGNVNTGNDTWDANCACTGQLIDCLGVPGGSALPGTACDDGNANTINDQFQSNCACAGTLVTIDCLGVPGGSALPGTSCDDGNVNTGNDTWDANCICTGQLIDCLGVPGGSALPGTACDDGNANTINDQFQNNCTCAGTLVTLDCLGVQGGSALPGTSCDDGNVNTGNDTWDANCICTGQLIDCLGVPGGSALPGTACDDGNANTINDQFQSNCTCAGTLVTIDCLGVPGGSALPGTSCDDGNANTGNDTWDANCTCAGQLIDCLGVPGGSALPGTACDDGNANTINDLFQNNCSCAGTLVTIDCLGVPGGSALPGTACDDGNANTGNDTWDANCACTGQLIDCLGVPGGSALPGTACDDGNANTINDQFQGNCTCAGTLVTIDCLGVPGGSALPGTSCDDGNANTGNDTWDGNCACTGQLIDCLGVPGGAALPGTACDDGNANTINDQFQSNCTCVGTLVTIDCMGVPNGTNLPGTPCDDADATTGNDTWDVNCICAGLFIDCLGVPGGTAIPGAPCDDMNSNTVNDSITVNCTCAGIPMIFDCTGVPNGTALPGTPCDDSNANTVNDLWQTDCACEGDLLDCLGVPGGSALPGSSCDDGDATTGNDAWDLNCTCAGLPIDCEGVPGGNALPGTGCDDGNPNTINDTWSAGCSCAGTLANYDCLGIPNGPNMPGTACNDGDPNTGNDAWDANCTCAGQLFDCLGVPGGTAWPGTPCDDGNGGTNNDLWDASCNCVGDAPWIDCTGTPGGTALPGTPCDDGDSTTGADTWNTNCECAGLPVDCNGEPGGTAAPDDCGICAGGGTGIEPNADVDGDELLACEDNCSLAFNPDQADFDGDGVGDACDNCVWVYNADQADLNSNGIGDACETIGIEEPIADGSFNLLPNPARGQVFVECSIPGARMLQFYDALGALVKESTLTTRIDLQDMAPGLYIVFALNAEGRPLAQTRLITQ